ncbi:arginase, hepatic-like isoform X1 [Crassostrea virginica]
MQHSREGKVGVLGCPMYHGQTKPGTKEGPAALRDAGLLEMLKDQGLDVEDFGDVNIPCLEEVPLSDLSVKNPKHVGAASANIATDVHKVLDSGRACLVLGGDHSLAIGSIYGHSLAEPDQVVVWVDAHADINTPLTSTSGNIHGMPLSFLVHELQPYNCKLPGFESIKPCISAKDIVYIGLRSVDPGERYIIEKFGIQSFSISEVDKLGIKEVVEKAINYLDPEGKRPIHLSFDVDALDPSLIPCTGTPVLGGLSFREGNYICEELAATGRLSCVDIVEVNPTLGNERDKEITVNAALQIITRCFGNRRQGIYPKDYIFPCPTHLDCGRID